MKRLTCIMTILILAIGLMAMTSAIQAQSIYYVDDDAPCDPGPGDPAVSSAFEDGSAAYPFDAIQEGIDAASDWDTVLVKDGVYSGFGNRNLNFGGRRITLLSENGPYNTIIYLRREDRGFVFFSAETADTRVEGFFIGWGLQGFGGAIYMDPLSSPSIVNCIIHGNEAENDGGGIYCWNDCNPKILNCLITDNVAENGAGMYLKTASSPELTGTQITGNYASNTGGGMYCGQSVDISSCMISENRADYGGGIFCYWDNDISHCTISDNHADTAGGGIYSGDTGSTFEHCTLTYNSADLEGAGFGGYGRITDCTINYSIGTGVVIKDDASSMTGCEICYTSGPGIFCYYGAPLIKNCLIAGSEGSGIYCWANTAPVFESCIITNNHSDHFGGGVFCQNEGHPEINHCTVTHNSAAQGGGGIYGYDGSHPTVTNSIFWDNDAPVGPEIYLREYSSDPSSLVINYSDVEGGESAASVGTGCALYWMWGMHSDDPLFADPDGPDDDALTWEDNDYHLSDYSLCIEAGDPFTYPASDDTDMDGEPRKVGARVDMGADEYIEEGAVFVCSLRCLTPVVHPGGTITFQTTVQNVTDQNQTAKYTYNVYLCNGDFFTEHRTVSPVAFSPYLTKTESVTSNVPASIPPGLKNCDLRYELVVSRRISGKVLCTSSCYFQIQDAPTLQPQLGGE